jgi:hypothetical protein
MNINGNL